MRVTEKLLRENNKKKLENNKNEEPELMEIYMNREKKKESINVAGSVFDSKLSSGINTEKSVFDKQSAFK